MKNLLASLLCVLALSSVVKAGEVSYTFNVPTNGGVLTTFDLPKFNPTQGVLTGIRIQTTWGNRAIIQQEYLNDDAGVFTSDHSLSSVVDITYSGGQLLTDIDHNQVHLETSGPFDGSLDYAGDSGVTFNHIYRHRASRLINNYFALLDFTGSGNMPLTVNMFASDSASISRYVCPGFSLVTARSMAAEVTITYEYQ